MVSRGDRFPTLQGVAGALTPATLSRGDVLALLRDGTVEEGQLHPQGSNSTFVVRLRKGECCCLAVYKPREGETPLWDFPQGTLYRREVASYLLCEALGWGFVPPTIVRDGPAGEGSMQLYIHHDPARHYFVTRETHLDAYRRIATFDFLANNADRKGGHCLHGRDGNIWGIDHGLTFNVNLKLRTVIWDFAEQRIPDQLIEDVRRVLGQLQGGNGATAGLEGLLQPAEIGSLRKRLEHLVEHPYYPPPFTSRSLPWPRI
ncbi:MAG: SCO1664 family protein [Candidatus Tectomicrobia bacterium]|nr:SCO1664 family protein [Candidatus Tectomicrobia bacterium]